MTEAQFIAYVHRLADRDWASAARLVAGALDLLPVGSTFNTPCKQRGSLPLIHTKTKDGGLDWHTRSTRTRLLLSGPQRGQERTETSNWQGSSWGYGISAALGRREQRDQTIMVVAYHALSRHGTLPVETEQLSLALPPSAAGIGHNGGPALESL